MANAEWTVMVYMVADTGESFYRAAMADIKEMVLAKFDADQVAVLVYADAPSPWQPRSWEVKGTTPTAEGKAVGKDCPHATILEFVKNCVSTHRAQHYLLVLWGHGEGIDWRQKVDGAQRGKRFAPGSQGVQEIAELGEVLRNLNLEVAATNLVVGFDACLMAMVEVYYEIRSKVGWVVAANDEIPDTGWPYQKILDKLGERPSIQPKSLAREIVKLCAQSYSEKSNESNVSFSACELTESKCTQLKNAVASLREALEQQVDIYKEEGLKVIRGARDFAEDYQERAYVDLHAFCKELGRVAEKTVAELDSKSAQDQLAPEQVRREGLTALKQRADGVVTALEGFVIDKGVTFSDEYPHKYMEDSRAVSICFPESEDLEGSIPGLQIDWESYRKLEFSRATDWPELAGKFWNKPRVA